MDQQLQQILPDMGHGTHKIPGGKPRIRQFTLGETTGMTMVVPVSLDGTRLSAVVGTAAQVSLIRQSVWEKIAIQHDAIPETV